MPRRPADAVKERFSVLEDFAFVHRGRLCAGQASEQEEQGEQRRVTHPNLRGVLLELLTGGHGLGYTLRGRGADRIGSTSLILRIDNIEMECILA